MACLGALVVLPIARASGSLQLVEIRLAAVGLVALVTALVLGWAPLIPVAIVIVGGEYAAQLAIDDSGLDSATPASAAGLLVTAELAYWSLEERDGACGEEGTGLRLAALVAGLGVATLLVTSALLALVDAARTTGLVIDLLGAAAAAAVLFAIVLAARGPGRARH